MSPACAWLALSGWSWRVSGRSRWPVGWIGGDGGLVVAGGGVVGGGGQVGGQAQAGGGGAEEEPGGERPGAEPVVAVGGAFWGEVVDDRRQGGDSRHSPRGMTTMAGPGRVCARRPRRAPLVVPRHARRNQVRVAGGLPGGQDRLGVRPGRPSRPACPGRQRPAARLGTVRPTSASPGPGRVSKMASDPRLTPSAARNCPGPACRTATLAQAWATAK